MAFTPTRYERCATELEHEARQATEPGARAILEAGQLLTIGPRLLLDAGSYVAAASWDGTAFRSYDTAGEHRGTFAGWGATQGRMIALALEWDGRAEGLLT